MGLFTKHKEKISSFGNGRVVALEAVPDPVFAGKMLGDGFALELSTGDIYAPVSGLVTMVYPTKHAIGIETKNGMELLLHLGIDTVTLAGEGFEILVEAGNSISQHQLLGRMDLDVLKKKEKNPISMCILTSGEKVLNLKLGLQVTPEDSDFIKL